MTDKSLLEQGKSIINSQPEDSLHAGVTDEGAEVTLNKKIGRGWSVFAWFQQKWDGMRSRGVGLQKKF